MKKVINSTISLILVLMCVMSLCACNTVDKAGLWENATYRRDMEFGKGDKTAVVEVKAGEESVIFTIHTDKSTVGEALLEHELIEGDQGDYGMYIKTVNGILADYDIDQSYWAFYIDGEYAMSGVDTTYIVEGGELILTMAAEGKIQQGNYLIITLEDIVAG